ncbi:MAG: MFS transporter, partial [Pseudomonadota bacterium]
MFDVMRNMWALFLGMLLLMVGNALQGSLIGVRAASEPSFTTEIFGYVSAAYFAGFLGGSQVTPYLLRRVGHVRVFAALASLVSAAFIIYAAIVDPWVWFVLRFIVGFCFSGIYIVSES